MMEKKLVALFFTAVFCLVTINLSTAASYPVFSLQPQTGLATSVLTQTEDGNDKEPISAWDRTWPILLAVGSFFLFRFLRSIQTDDDDE